ncbi:MAG TPA: class I SAM-dependent methyltransferase [Verrucomicrobiae bacterium]|nr:class I SAM-dependent methyltransferase [Verrucomicrobiae bacterium]
MAAAVTLASNLSGGDRGRRRASSGARGLLGQCRRPTGWIGRFVLWSMNARHARSTDWGLSHVSIRPGDTILDVGCGGGRTIHKLAGLATEGRLHGLDHSEESVAASRRTNARLVREGRVEIGEGSVSRLPYPDGTFDLVTGVETHFFWPDLPADMREVLRVLKPGGTLLLVAEIYRGGSHESRIRRFGDRLTEIAGMTLLSVEEHRDLFSRAGYSRVQVFEEPAKGWICGVGTRTS